MICEICKKRDCHDGKHKLLEINGYYVREGKKTVFKLTEIGKKLAEEFNIEIDDQTRS
jgi:hypothetical protein